MSFKQKYILQLFEIYKINFAILRHKPEERLSNRTAVKQKEITFFKKRVNSFIKERHPSQF